MGTMITTDRSTRVTVPSASMPSGFTVFGKGLSDIRPGSQRIPSDATVRPTALDQASHRQRGVSRWPSGNSSSRNTPVSPIPGTHSMLSIDAVTAARSCEPRCSSSP